MKFIEKEGTGLLFDGKEVTVGDVFETSSFIIAAPSTIHERKEYVNYEVAVVQYGFYKIESLKSTLLAGEYVTTIRKYFGPYLHVFIYSPDRKEFWGCRQENIITIVLSKMRNISYLGKINKKILQEYPELNNLKG